ncbi:MAG: hypothetical protein R3266_12990, partial [Gemmatimonadota bacterium]|nr:hypothetical protein [Gemmatimonadota bacterium]
IPVVLVEDEGWRPPARLLQVAAGLMILLGIGFIAWPLVSGGPDAPSARGTPIRPATGGAERASEFTRLSTRFRQSLQDYRSDFVDFQAGQAPCATLVRSFTRVRATLAELSSYAATRAEGEAVLSSLEADFEAAKARFDETSCEAPASSPTLPSRTAGVQPGEGAPRTPDGGAPPR